MTSILYDIERMCRDMYRENKKVLNYYYSTPKLKKHFF